MEFSGDFDHPERPKPNSNHYEFVARCTLENGRLRPGRNAQYMDHSFPLKTFLTHRAGICRDTIRELPWGPELLRAYDAGAVTDEMEEAVLREHFLLLRQMALQKAESANLSIEWLVLSFPNYLCEGGWHDQYMSYYLKLILPLWPDVEIRMCSEGQCAALYVCEPFDDPLNTMNRKKFWQDLSDMKKEGAINLLVADNRGSTLVWNLVLTVDVI